jgi:hypothetical protein
MAGDHTTMPLDPIAGGALQPDVGWSWFRDTDHAALVHRLDGVLDSEEYGLRSTDMVRSSGRADFIDRTYRDRPRRR